MKNFAAIIIAGNDKPMGSSLPTHRLRIHGKDAIDYSVEILEKHCGYVSILETHKERGELADEIYSVASALATLPSRSLNFILLHDASRPLLSEDTVEEMIQALTNGLPIVVAGSRIQDTLWINAEPSSKENFCLQTPEGLSLDLLLEILHWRRIHPIDSASPTIIAWLWRRLAPQIIPQRSNPKIKSIEDLAAIEGILKFGQLQSAQLMPDLRGLHILVLGGSGGIGKACIKMIKESGATFDAPTRSELNLDKRPAFDNLGRYHAILHSAGAYEGDADEILRVNFLSCVDLLSCAERTGWTGNIVFVSSSSSTWGRPGIPYYSASKAALNALVEAESDRLAAKGIIINAIAPGKVDTRLQSIINPHLTPEFMITPEYVARVASSYMTTKSFGNIIYVRKGFDQ